jgi:hypothetical protein
MATIWKGSLAFGLVQVPVELKPAVRAERLSFRQLHEEDHAPIKYERVSSKSGEVVPWREIVKGYEYTKGKFVVLTDEDFRAAALESSRTIDIVFATVKASSVWRSPSPRTPRATSVSSACPSSASSGSSICISNRPGDKRPISNEPSSRVRTLVRSSLRCDCVGSGSTRRESTARCEARKGGALEPLSTIVIRTMTAR